MLPDLGDELIQRWAETLAEEWHNGKRLSELTDSQRADCYAEARAISISEAEHEYDRRIERTK